MPLHNARHQFLSPAAGYISAWQLPLTACLATQKGHQAGCACTRNTLTYLSPLDDFQILKLPTARGLGSSFAPWEVHLCKCVIPERLWALCQSCGHHRSFNRVPHPSERSRLPNTLPACPACANCRTNCHAHLSAHPVHSAPWEHPLYEQGLDAFPPSSAHIVLELLLITDSTLPTREAGATSYSFSTILFQFCLCKVSIDASLHSKVDWLEVFIMSAFQQYANAESHILSHNSN